VVHPTDIPLPGDYYIGRTFTGVRHRGKGYTVGGRYDSSINDDACAEFMNRPNTQHLTKNPIIRR